MTERKPFTDEDLARIEALGHHWTEQGVSYGRLTGEQLSALIAEVRALRAELKHIDEANTALGSQVIDLMQERDEARQALAE